MTCINQKSVLPILLVILTILSVYAFSYANFTEVSERTPAVRDAIVSAMSGVDNAIDVTETHVAAITSLNLRAEGITELKSGDFSGMSSLTNLNLFNNELSSLPDGVFEGLTSLTTLRLGGNTVDPLPITVTLEVAGDNQFKAVVPTGAPFAITLPISVSNGSISGAATTLTIAQGGVESAALTLTRLTDSLEAVTVNIGTLPSLPSNHYGYTLSKPNTLPLEVIGEVVTTTPVVPVEPPNVPEDSSVTPPVDIAAAPVFTDGAATSRAVAENTAAAENIGAAVTATDVNNDEITYSLSGTDAGSFSLDNTSGQLMTRAALDYEMKRIYVLTITASDGTLTDTISVIIRVIEVADTDFVSVSLPVSDRTPQVRDAIVAAVPGITDAANVTDNHLATITSLNLRSAGISELKKVIFLG